MVGRQRCPVRLGYTIVTLKLLTPCYFSGTDFPIKFVATHADVVPLLNMLMNIGTKDGDFLAAVRFCRLLLENHCKGYVPNLPEVCNPTTLIVMLVCSLTRVVVGLFLRTLGRFDSWWTF
mgnify:CR=1 FL=1